MNITPKTTVEQIRLNISDALEIFDSFGIECAKCIGGGETLESAAAMHDIDVEDIIEALNESIENG